MSATISLHVDNELYPSVKMDNTSSGSKILIIEQQGQQVTVFADEDFMRKICDALEADLYEEPTYQELDKIATCLSNENDELKAVIAESEDYERTLPYYAGLRG